MSQAGQWSQEATNLGTNGTATVLEGAALAADPTPSETARGAAGPHLLEQNSWPAFPSAGRVEGVSCRLLRVGLVAWAGWT